MSSDGNHLILLTAAKNTRSLSALKQLLMKLLLSYTTTGKEM